MLLIWIFGTSSASNEWQFTLTNQTENHKGFLNQVFIGWLSHYAIDTHCTHDEYLNTWHERYQSRAIV